MQNNKTGLAMDKKCNDDSLYEKEIYDNKCVAGFSALFNLPWCMAAMGQRHVTPSHVVQHP